ncbi:sialate O-acetylesterase [Blastomonas sp. AAP25]|uniref:sialate O-acetylesterase n=1 Tax=Blastomonas sp. AAP25 TaxID=1523416 RepID=UPI000A64693F|nr:sialate O-acetylesterase [Blastomonas sp. AAP25]
MLTAPFRPSINAMLASACILGSISPALAAELDPAFASHAVIQRDRPIPVSGTADPGETVTVEIGAHVGTAVAGRDGRFRIVLPAMAAGGPYRITVAARSGTSIAEDVLIGDVFLCSGQSNMEMTIAESQDSRAQIANSGDTAIRMMTVPRQTALDPRVTFEKAPRWDVAGPQTAGAFSAACFYMLKDLRRTVDVPLGAIHSSWGGTRISSWMSDAALGQTGAAAEVQLRQLSAKDPTSAQRGFGTRWESWWRAAHKDAPWMPDADRDWRPVPKIGYWEDWGDPELVEYNGFMWLRRELMLTAAQVAQGASLDLGLLDDQDVVWINGRPVGGGGSISTPRRYALPKGSLKAGRNVVTVNVNDLWGKGGMAGPADSIAVTFRNGQRLPLGEGWSYSPDRRRAPGMPRPPWDDTAGAGNLYAAMIAPLGSPALKGVAWYQGESDTALPGYAGRLSAMIAAWRVQFDTPNLPFAIVSLAGFGAPAAAPGASGWADVRNDQRKVAVNDPRVGLTLTLDIGDPFDVHPGEKRELGRRLARTMRAIAYGGPDSASGPSVRFVTRGENAVVVTFEGVTGSLVTRGSTQAIGFELCGADQASCRFVPGIIAGNQVTLPQDGAAPTRVRYAWADAPTINLFDSAGLPAGPFELPIP